MENIYTVSQAKARAKSIREEAKARGHAVSHSQALETLAHECGLKNWNILRAKLSDLPIDALVKGSPVTGHYLGHPFSGKVSSIKPFGTQGFRRIEIDLDAAIDVVAFESFSSLRKRLSATINPFGQTIETISTGQPQLSLDI